MFRSIPLFLFFVLAACTEMPSSPFTEFPVDGPDDLLPMSVARTVARDTGLPDLTGIDVGTQNDGNNNCDANDGNDGPCAIADVAITANGNTSVTVTWTAHAHINGGNDGYTVRLYRKDRNATTAVQVAQVSVAFGTFRSLWHHFPHVHRP